jgi:DNA polymerase-3 subunit delta'
LPTIRSRCQRLPLAALAPSLVRELLRRHRPDLAQGEVEALARLAEGSIGRAIELADAGGILLYRSMLELLRQTPQIDVARLYAFADKLTGSDAEDTYRASQELLSQFLARMVVWLARGQSDTDDLVASEEGAVMQHLAIRADPGRWAALRDQINSDFASADELSLDRKQAILGAFFAIEELAR